MYASNSSHFRAQSRPKSHCWKSSRLRPHPCGWRAVLQALRGSRSTDSQPPQAHQMSPEFASYRAPLAGRLHSPQARLYCPSPALAPSQRQAPKADAHHHKMHQSHQAAQAWPKPRHGSEHPSPHRHICPPKRHKKIAASQRLRLLWHRSFRPSSRQYGGQILRPAPQGFQP